MNLYQRLLTETTQERDYLLSSPIIQRCFNGDIELSDYVAFLTQAYHHVKHTAVSYTHLTLPTNREV